MTSTCLYVYCRKARKYLPLWKCTDCYYGSKDFDPHTFSVDNCKYCK